MTTWRQVAHELEAILADEDEEIGRAERRAYAAGWRDGVLSPLTGDQRSALMEAYQAGRSEGFTAGLAFAERHAAAREVA
jgi:flagellar biosynthesis/type III secretory pathway protein FliH